MGHEISTNNAGRKAEAYFADKPAWHGLGTVVAGARTSDEVIKLAGLDWSVEQRELYAKAPGVDADGQLAEVEVPVASHKLNVRSDNGYPLGVVSKGWKPFQNADAFRFLDGISTTGKMRYESAGALKDGKLVWALARMNDLGRVTRVGGDEHRRYLFIYVGHDGTRAIKVIPTDVRVVCWNTATLAEKEATRKGNAFTVAHNARDLEASMQRVSDLIVDTHEGFDQQIALWQHLSGIAVDEAQVEAFLLAWKPVMETPLGATDELAESIRVHNVKATNLHENVSAIFADDATCNTQAGRGTAYGLINAVTRYYDHGRRTVTPGTKFESNWIGTGASEKSKAISAAKEVFAG